MNIVRNLGVSAFFCMLMGCGNETGVTIGSEAFDHMAALSSAMMTDVPVTEFKFCVSRVRLIDEDGESSEVIFAPGLIDVSDGAAAEWGKIEIPLGFKLASMRVKVHKDKDLCGVDYSIAFNGATTPQDIEFKWKFDPAIEVDGTAQKVNVSLEEVVSDLKVSVSTTGDLPSLKNRVEGVEGSAHVE